MQTYSYKDVERNLSVILDLALTEDVIIKNRNGIDFKLSHLAENKNEKSPFEGIKTIKANITTQEIVELIREGRTGKN